MRVRIGIGRLVSLVLQVMDITEDRLEDHKDYYYDAEDWVEGPDLEEGGSQSACAVDIQRKARLTSAAPLFAMYTPSPSPRIAPK